MVFSFFEFFPNNNILPVWIGSHFDKNTRLALEKIGCVRDFQKIFSYGIGSRDISTLKFLQKQQIETYLSRCLTLTFPRRENLKTQKEIVLVDLPLKYEKYIPKSLSNKARRINQRWVNTNHEHWSKTLEKAELLLAYYRDFAKLVITPALHVAAPCIAMGIPVILIADDPEENFQRYSALSGITKYYTVNDLRQKNIDFSPTISEIEDLKNLIVKNLYLSVLQSWGEPISLDELTRVREEIQNFNILE